MFPDAAKADVAVAAMEAPQATAAPPAPPPPAPPAPGPVELESRRKVAREALTYVGLDPDAEEVYVRVTRQ